ncbi:hypothetical protein HYS47_05630 [Candidatus Woesearchaeota archaeon]|nr:hypothetical protein [Candidatus Woesearchaeota archaeon]
MVKPRVGVVREVRRVSKVATRGRGGSTVGKLQEENTLSYVRFSTPFSLDVGDVVEYDIPNPGKANAGKVVITRKVGKKRFA